LIQTPPPPSGFWLDTVMGWLTLAGQLIGIIVALYAFWKWNRKHYDDRLKSVEVNCAATEERTKILVEKEVKRLRDEIHGDMNEMRSSIDKDLNGLGTRVKHMELTLEKVLEGIHRIDVGMAESKMDRGSLNKRLDQFRLEQEQRHRELINVLANRQQ
jgi:hypothetical protein